MTDNLKRRNFCSLSRASPFSFLSSHTVWSNFSSWATALGGTLSWFVPEHWQLNSSSQTHSIWNHKLMTNLLLFQEFPCTICSHTSESLPMLCISKFKVFYYGNVCQNIFPQNFMLSWYDAFTQGGEWCAFYRTQVFDLFDMGQWSTQA